jgi:Flp pilus assembly protein TadD
MGAPGRFGQGILAALAGAALLSCTAEPSRKPGSGGSGGPGDPVGVLDASAPRPPKANTLYSMARIMVSRSRDADAETILAKLIAEHPDFLPAYADLAELYLRHDHPDSAVLVLESGLQVAPKDAVLWNDLGMCRLQQKRYEDAVDGFTKAAAGVPHDARSRANLAVALGMLGRLEESLAVYLQVVSPAEAHHNLGVLCQARGDAARAEQEFAAAEALSAKADGSSNP